MPRKRKKRDLKAAGKWWSESQKIEAVTTWLALGSIPLTAAATDIPKDTLVRWRYTDWWKELVLQIRSEETLALDGRLSKIVTKALSVVEDRLDNGNFQYDPKTGGNVRVPVNLRDSMKATADLMDRREMLRKQPQQEQIEKTVDDRLAKLADEFARFAKAKDVTPKPEALTLDIIES
jgi:hypothetical protein